MNFKPQSDGWSTVIPIAVFFAMKFGADAIASLVGIPTRIDFDDPIEVDHGSYEDEVDGITTDFGMYGFFLAGVFAWWADLT